MFANGQLVQPSDDGSRPGYGGTKVDNNIQLRNNGNAFDVEIQRGPEVFRKSFNIKNYKNKSEALNAAKKFRDQKKKISFKTGIQEPKYGSVLDRKEYMKVYNEATRPLTDAGKLAKERDLKLKNFIGKKKKIKSSVLRDFILNDIGYGNYDTTKIKKKFPNLIIEKDLSTTSPFEPLTKQQKTDRLKALQSKFDFVQDRKNQFRDKDAFGDEYTAFSALEANKDKVVEIEKQARAELASKNKKNPTKIELFDQAKIIYNTNKINAEHAANQRRGLNDVINAQTKEEAVKKVENLVNVTDANKKAAIDGINNGNHGVNIPTTDNKNIPLQVVESMAADDRLEMLSKYFSDTPEKTLFEQGSQQQLDEGQGSLFK